MKFREKKLRIASFSSKDPKGKVCMHTGEVAFQERAFPGFCRMNLLSTFPLPPASDASTSQGYPQH